MLPIRVGENTLRGQHLKDFLIYQIGLENDIPKVCYILMLIHVQRLTLQLLNELPAVEMSALNSGSYFLNLHVVKGLKPSCPRPGDLLKDGARQDMTASTYDAMAHSMARNDSKAPCKRYSKEEVSPILIANPEQI